MTDGPIWLTEADVTGLVSLPEALAALRATLAAEGAGLAHNIPKALGRFDGGAMHCLGAMHAKAGVVGWKTWAITGQGGAVTYELFDARTGALLAVIEAVALGQLRTAAMTGLGTDLLAPADAASLAIIGAGRQAMAQVAAIVAVRPIKNILVYSRDERKRTDFAARIAATFPLIAEPAPSAAAAAAEAAITTLVTRAEQPFLHAAMLPRGAHLNAVGAILPSHAEFADDVFARADLIGVDSVADVQRNSREFRDHFGEGDWSVVRPIGALLAEGTARTDGDADLTLFKSMGMGLSDLAVAAEVYRRAIAQNIGRALGKAGAGASSLVVMQQEIDAMSFVDLGAVAPPRMQGWDPIVVKRTAIEREIARLAAAPRPINGVRAARIVHPAAREPGLGLSPGIDVTLSVLHPGEETIPRRGNASEVSLCLRGRGQARIGQRRFAIERFDVWNTPGMHPYSYRNDGEELLVRLSYSNGALLEKLHIHFVEDMPARGFDTVARDDGHDARIDQLKSRAAPILLDPDDALGARGAQLLTYEHLIAPEVVDNQALLWAWRDIVRERDRVFPVGRGDKLGRRGLFVLYNPATGRTVGTTHSFFASLGFMPAQVLDKPHRHSSNAINYALEGGFVSSVDGKTLEWEEGDIAYTAPGWSAHANGSINRAGGTALTVQDHPFQIATECLIWQEHIDQPILLLGQQQGFAAEEAVLVG